MYESASNSRYDRQLILKELGANGQARLQKAKVLVIGAGGLGCPALQYLVAAGVGHIGIVDGDTVQMTNLHRQPLYSEADIGMFKASIAKEKLLAQNPTCRINSFECFLSTSNAWDIITHYDIVLDGSDNFSTRYLVNDICVLLKKPLIFGAVYRYEGQLAVWNLTHQNNHRTANYRDLYPKPPLPNTVPNCNTAGVLGPLPGIIGTMQATEVIKLITGIGQPLSNKLLTYNLLNHETFIVAITPTEAGEKALPISREMIENSNYNISCDMPVATVDHSISVESFETLRHSANVEVIDVREPGETPLINAFEHRQIPLSILMLCKPIKLSDTVIFFCQSGQRSLQAAAWAKQQQLAKTTYSLAGGITAWLQLNQSIKEVHGA